MSPGYNFVFKVPIKSKSISGCFYHTCTALYLITVSGPTMVKINHFRGILMGPQSVVKVYSSCTHGHVIIFLLSFSHLFYGAVNTRTSSEWSVIGGQVPQVTI